MLNIEVLAYRMNASLWWGLETSPRTWTHSRPAFAS
jgi:hypothetical protein